jgi:hypothetical protein
VDEKARQYRKRGTLSALSQANRNLQEQAGVCPGSSGGVGLNQSGRNLVRRVCPEYVRDAQCAESREALYLSQVWRLLDDNRQG